MNQPSAEELEQFVYDRLGTATEKEAKMFAGDLLHNYILTRKSEPIPGVVSAKDIFLSGKVKIHPYGDSLWIELAKEGKLDQQGDVFTEFDIYPKGTVSRLMREVDELKTGNRCLGEEVKRLRAENEQLRLDQKPHNYDLLSEENQRFHAEFNKLNAEIDRLKGHNDEFITFADPNVVMSNGTEPEAVGCGEQFQRGGLTWTCSSPEFLCQKCLSDYVYKKQFEPLKPEAVGCGRPFAHQYNRLGTLMNWRECVSGDPCPDCQAKQTKPEAVGCGKIYHDGKIAMKCGRVYKDNFVTLCPDCQAKANQPEKPESSKVTLPEVPDWFKVADTVWVKTTERFMRAVKEHLEGKDGSTS